MIMAALQDDEGDTHKSQKEACADMPRRWQRIGRSTLSLDIHRQPLARVSRLTEKQEKGFEMVFSPCLKNLPIDTVLRQHFQIATEAL